MKILAALTVALLAVTSCGVDASPPYQPDPWTADRTDPLARDKPQEPTWEGEGEANAGINFDGNIARPLAAGAVEEREYIAETGAQGERAMGAGTWAQREDLQEVAAPFATQEEETLNEGAGLARVAREGGETTDSDDSVKSTGASVEYGGKKYELPDDFDKSAIGDEADVDEILAEYEDKVDDEIKGGLHYIAASNASNPDGVNRNCQDHYTAGARVNGVYTIHPKNSDNLAIDVWCDFYTSSGEGWTVISKRCDGSEFFYRNYATYRAGFGSVHGEFWLGLEQIRQISQQEPYILRVDLWDCADSHRFAEYDYFALGPSATNYELLIGLYSGDAGDSLSFHRYQKFSAYDSDNDGYSGNCAGLYKGAWWYGDCYETSLNGLYYNCDENGVPPGHTGTTWKTFGGYETSLPRVELKIKPYS